MTTRALKVIADDLRAVVSDIKAGDPPDTDRIELAGIGTQIEMICEGLTDDTFNRARC